MRSKAGFALPFARSSQLRERLTPSFESPVMIVCSIDGMDSLMRSTMSSFEFHFPLYVYQCDAIRTFGPICLNLSTALVAPKSGAQLDQTAPIEAHARRDTTVSGTLGR